jgi:hypothetical protein
LEGNHISRLSADHLVPHRSLAVLRCTRCRSRPDSCLARRASFAPIRFFELGVPESVLSIDSRRSSSATRSSSRRSRLRDALSPDSAASSRVSAASTYTCSTAICSSFAAITARSCDTSSCSPVSLGSSDTSRKHAQPELTSTPQHLSVSRRSREWKQRTVHRVYPLYLLHMIVCAAQAAPM